MSLQEPVNRRKRLVTNLCRAFGILVLLVWLVPVFAHELSRQYTSDTDVPAPTTKVFYLGNYSKSEVKCTITPEVGETRVITLKPIDSVWRFDGLMGFKVERWYDGLAVMSCTTDDAQLNTGPLLWTYPLAQGIELPIIAFLLSAYGWRERLSPTATRMRKRGF